MGIKTLKTKLDNIFSLYIRLREATDEGLVQCFTCGNVNNYKVGMQNGHFMSRQFMATRYDEQNCQVQCVGCNMFKSGEQFKFSLALDYKYGKGTAEELLHKSRQINKMSSKDFEEKISYYKSLVEKLLKEKGLSLKK
jgi:hypothetical protein